MKWYSIKTQQPIHGQRILVYHPELKDHIDEFLDGGIWPISKWNEKENKCQDDDGTLFEITEWTAFVLPNVVMIEKPKRRVKPRKSDKTVIKFLA